MADESKTPISQLQELSVVLGLVAKYDMVANEGAIHEPLFVFKVTIGNIVASGKGPSKKKAKHTAAVNAITQLMLIPEYKQLLEGWEGFTPGIVSNENQGLYNDQAGETLRNPVGELQEVTQKKMWLPPEYEFSMERGLPHDREFVCSVRVCDRMEEATGKSKKLAKRNAAQLMLERIKQGHVHPTSINNNRNAASKSDVPFVGNDPNLAFMPSNHFTDPSIHHNDTNNNLPLTQQQNNNHNNTKKKISTMFVTSCKTTKVSKCLKALQKIDFDYSNGFQNRTESSITSMDAPVDENLPKIRGSLKEVVDDETGHQHDPLMDLLEELGGEQGFKCTFHDLPLPSLHSQYSCQCLVHLSSSPPVVAHGEGRSAYEARKDACYKALQHLQILTRKPV